MRPYNVSFHTSRRGHLRLTCLSYKDVNQYGNDKGQLFPYWLHHGIPRGRCFTESRQIMGK